MNPSHVVYGACMRDYGVECYGGPQGPRNLLDNGDFGLATWEHQSLSPLLRVLQYGQNQPLLVAASFSTFVIFLPLSTAASIPTAISAINLHHLAAASIPAAIDQHFLVAQAP
ncbi:hypothetical protein Pyn_26078 [Prunus yedoensis var. nudiflora]|uniref:Uncharacterized protein n=1 Tax=Prunus yedoensis var. nudiflora TaxID=2094558 RepID=A0A314YJD4_PRUYE|nr:hypothetical protein Pyn_26078 [Prunus yedoensis var. nudiflora]